MIIMPPEELQKYITIDDKGEWKYEPSMPKDLIPQFEEFVKNVKNASNYRMDD